MRTALRHALSKVPEITVYFWIIKALTTALGESTSDYLVHALNPILAVALGAVGFAVALALQFLTRRYVPWVYWLTVVMVAVFGTMAADVLHIGLGIPYLVSTVFFAIALGIIFALWYACEKTLSIHSIDSTRRELFYWATVVATFALGTAAGDMTAITWHLGYVSSGVLFAAVLAFITILHYAVKGILAEHHLHQSRNAVLAFWLAYIFTRPLGASFADWMGKAQSLGGLGWGGGLVSLGFAFLIIFFVGYLTFSSEDIERHAE